MDVEVKNNVREIANDSGIGKSSTNGIQRNKEDGVEVVNLATDIPKIYSGDISPNLSDFVSQPGDARFLSKEDLLKSLSDIDNIVITNSSAKFPPEDMLMHYIDNSSALQMLSEESRSAPKSNFHQDSAATNVLKSSSKSQKNETDDNSANGEDSDDYRQRDEIRNSVFRQSRRKGDFSKNKNGYNNGKFDNFFHILPSSIKSSISETIHNDVSHSEVLDSFSINIETYNHQNEKSSICHSGTVLDTTKTVTKKAAIEAVSAILPNKNDNQDVISDNGETPTKRARRACVQQFQGINIYKEEESETTCTLESDEETSEDDDDADESSIQEEENKDKSENIKSTKNKTDSLKSSPQPETKGKRGRPRKTESSPNKKLKCQDDNEDDSDVDVVDIPEDFVEVPSLRKRRQAQRGKDRRKLDAARRHKEAVRKLTQIFRKPVSERTGAEKKFLTAQTARAINEAKKRNNVKQTIDDRKKEIEDPEDVLSDKCAKLAAAIAKAKNLVVYTGAGISTAADIPDYRGPNGIWTLLDQGAKLTDTAQYGDRFCRDLALARPTTTHMALFALYKRGRLKHIVSQNCDGLHLRSGIPRYAMSELHGNMFIEICKRCKPMRPFVRLFDVTERTSKHRHTTMRRCHVCGQSLFDTIVHFGEKGSLKWPLNWDGAGKAAEKADVILCLGSSLKVLRRYTWLWCMDRPKKDRPKLYIANLQWTPKDSAATLKINGRCDEIMKRVMENLSMTIPKYCGSNDPLLSYTTRLHPQETHTTHRLPINSISYNDKPSEDTTEIKTEIKTEPGEIANVNIDLNKALNGLITPENSWVLDHPYCAKLLEVKIKKEQEELMDRLKNGSGASCHNNPLPPVIQKPLFKHSIETILSTPSTNSMTQVITESIIPKVENNILMVNGFKFELKGNIETKPSNGEILETSNNPSTPVTSSAATSRASSPSSLPRRMSTRKKKEPAAWTSYSSIVPEKKVSKAATSKIAKNGLVKSSKVIDYANIKWPRDALYIPYTYPEQLHDGKSEQDKLSYKFEYIQELEANGEPAYYCDCCDPKRKPQPRKRRRRKHSKKKTRSGSSDSTSSSSNSSSSSSSSSSESSSSSSSSSSSDDSSDEDSEEEDSKEAIPATIITNEGSSKVDQEFNETKNESKHNGGSKRKKKKKSSKSRKDGKEDDSNNESPASSVKSGPTTPTTTSTLKPIGWYGKGRKSGNKKKLKNKL